MPNMVNNRLIMSHADLAMMDRAVTAFNNDRLVQEFFPDLKTNLDTNDTKVTDDGDGIFTFAFNSKWVPPLQVYKRLEELGFDVEAYYFESDAAFCGIRMNGEDFDFQVPVKSTDVVKTIPGVLDEMFNISSDKAEHEEEEEVEEENV